MMPRTTLVVALLASLAAACGSSPASPTPTPAPTPAPTPTPTPTPTPAPTTPSISGTWTGPATIANSGQITSEFTLQQSDASVSGTWRVTSPSTNDSHGNISGTITGTGDTATFSGQATISAASSDPNVRCSGTATVSGSVSAIRLDWTTGADGFKLDNCSGNIGQVHWTLSR